MNPGLPSRPVSPSFTVHWCKNWEGRAMHRPEDCSHSNEFGTEVLNIKQRLEPKKGKRAGHDIVLEGSICMDCGTDIVGGFTLAEGLRLCMDQHGWNREVGLRLYDLAEFHQDELIGAPCVPLWCFYAFGWSGKEIVDALNSGKLLPSQMSERVEALSAELRP